MNEFHTIFLFFFIYSVLGWILETLYCRMLDGKWTNRGFMFGPYCPIYGFGSLLIIYFLDYFKESPIEVFFLGMIFTSVLEYITSFLLEKMFNAKWWDYSKRKFNINGRVCLLNSTEFAVLGLLLTYIVHPFISIQIAKIPSYMIEYLFVGIFCIMLIDCCSTVFSLLNLKEKLEVLKDMAEKFKEQNIKNHKQITDLALYNELSEYRKKMIARHHLQVERILEAFPNFEFRDFKKQLEEFKLEIHLFRENKRNELIERKRLRKEEKEIKKLKEKK